jgi:hypothetical protein
MNRPTVVRVLLPISVALFVAGGRGSAQISLELLTPENYGYEEATRCINCKSMGSDIKYRVVGVDLSSGSPTADERGWLASVHARSQSYGDRVNTACAWCHAPLTEGATQDDDAAVPIEKGTWQGVTCGACHPAAVPQEERHSQLANFIPGSDATDPSSYVFRDRTDPKQFNVLGSGVIRCVDCHMAGYGVAANQLVERFHNMKVEANIPLSCSGAYGTEMSCHADESAEWMRSKLNAVKGERKDW